MYSGGRSFFFDGVVVMLGSSRSSSSGSDSDSGRAYGVSSSSSDSIGCGSDVVEEITWILADFFFAGRSFGEDLPVSRTGNVRAGGTAAGTIRGAVSEETFPPRFASHP
jgi:hypothetical protein